MSTVPNSHSLQTLAINVCMRLVPEVESLLKVYGVDCALDSKKLSREDLEKGAFWMIDTLLTGGSFQAVNILEDLTPRTPVQVVENLESWMKATGPDLIVRLTKVLATQQPPEAN